MGFRTKRGHGQAARTECASPAAGTEPQRRDAALLSKAVRNLRSASRRPISSGIPRWLSVRDRQIASRSTPSCLPTRRWHKWLPKAASRWAQKMPRHFRSRAQWLGTGESDSQPAQRCSCCPPSPGWLHLRLSPAVHPEARSRIYAITGLLPTLLFARSCFE